VWRIVPPVVFALVSAEFALEAAVDHRSVGSHALLYTEAARAWIDGGDPWTVGRPLFAGPPPMLVPFVPFVGLSPDLTRAVWVLGSLVLAILILRRLKLPGWWIGFPPIAQVIELGHPEVLLLALLVLGGPLAGLAPLVKPYFGPALLAERRWRAIALGLAALVVTIPILPWAQFVREFSTIEATAAAQSIGDSVFGEPVLMLIAVVALASLGPRRALWLAMPLLWPGRGQPFYKVACLPAMSPLLAVFWAIPIPGFTLLGVVTLAAADRYVSARGAPTWLAVGIDAPGLRHLGPPGEDAQFSGWTRRLRCGSKRVRTAGRHPIEPTR
jgi:hypothetical protein